MKVLPNDGLSEAGKELLINAGFEIIEEKIAQTQLSKYITDNQIDILLVRSATQVRKDLIDTVPNLKIIGRGGVGMDNIDVEYAKSKGIKVINTPTSSIHSVAELVFAHLLTLARNLHYSNREMPLEGDNNFKTLKKSYSDALELKGKVLGIIGFGKIGQETAKIGIALGMKILAYDREKKKQKLELSFFDGQKLSFEIESIDMDTVLENSDFITIHTPKLEKYIIGKKELAKIKKGGILVNAARGGVVDELALIDTIKEGILRSAALDVFENEPNPEMGLLMNPDFSFSPHIGANTNEAQERIGIELAKQIIELVKNV